MSSIDQYELLKQNGTHTDRLKFIISLSDRSEIEKHLKEKSSSSHDDLQMLINLSILMKNEKNLFQIFQTDSIPIGRRIFAIRRWLRLQKDEKQIYKILVESINDKNIPRL